MDEDDDPMTDQQKKLFKKWLCPNIFSCMICQKYTFKRRDSFTTHVTRQHKCGISEYESMHGKLVDTRHHCKECQRQLRQDQLPITQHFKSFHQGEITVEQYFLKHIIQDMPDLEESSDEEESIEDSEENQFEIWAKLKTLKCQICTRKVKSFKQEHFLYKHVESDHNMEPKLYNHRYQTNKASANSTKTCKLCEYQGDNLGMVVYHALKNHELTPAQYMNKYEPEEDCHQCKLCHKRLKKQSLTTHFELKDCHRPRITLRQYYDRYIKNSCTSNEFTTMSQMNTDSSDDNTVDESAKIKQIEQQIELSLKERQAFRMWLRPIKYHCKICSSFTTRKRGEFFKHLEHDHNTKWTDYKSKISKIFEKCHTCQLCKMQILQTAASLKKHFRIYHEGMMDIRSYFVHHVANVKGRDELNDSDRELLGEWLCPTLHRCKVCKSFNTKIRHRLTGHLRFEHKMGSKEYTSKFGGIESTLHSCRICKKKIVQEKSNIKSHLKKDHGGIVTIEEYFLKYIKAKPKGSRVSGDEDIDMNQPSLGEVLEWSNQCHFDCKICGNYTAPKSHFVARHIKKVHNKSAIDNINSNKNFHKCHRCDSLIMHRRSDLREHLTYSCHSPMNLRDYYEKFIHGRDEEEENKRSVENIEQAALKKSFYKWAERCSWLCPICGYATTNGGSFKKHLHTEHNSSFMGMKEMEGIDTYQLMSKSAMHKCRLCAKSIFHDPSLIKQHTSIAHGLSGSQYYEKFYLHDNENSEDIAKAKEDMKFEKLVESWAKAVSFVCQICEQKCSDSNPFKMHLINMHKITIDEYAKVYKQFVVRHMCRLCGKMFQHTRSEIKRHLHLAHDDLSINEYFTDFILEDLELRQSHSIKDVELVKLDCLDLGVSNNYKKWLKQLPLICKICKKDSQTFHVMSSFGRHLKSGHGGMTMQAYSDKFGGYWRPDEEKLHSCQPCGGKRILLFYDRLSWHARDAHKMTLEEYFEKFVMRKTFHWNH